MGAGARRRPEVLEPSNSRVDCARCADPVANKGFCGFNADVEDGGCEGGLFTGDIDSGLSANCSTIDKNTFIFHNDPCLSCGFWGESACDGTPLNQSASIRVEGECCWQCPAGDDNVHRCDHLPEAGVIKHGCDVPADAGGVDAAAFPICF